VIVLREGNLAVTTTLNGPRNGAQAVHGAGIELHRVDAEADSASVALTGERARTARSSNSLTPGSTTTDDDMRTLHLVRTNRTVAVWLTVAIATVSFVLSFTSLRNLAAMSAWPGWPSWLWPLIIDGLIILATLSIVALAPYRDQSWNRVFIWGVLSGAALVSVGGNALHAWLATDHLIAWMRWGSAGLACAPPAALLVTTHILAILWRFNPTPPPDPTSQLRDRAFELAVERMDKWEAAAAKMHEQGYCQNVPTVKIAHALRYLYESRPALSLRAIGGKPEVGLHHDSVGKIRDAAPVVLGVAPTGER
jgi:Protein of unknown function (DUF2637)